MVAGCCRPFRILAGYMLRSPKLILPFSLALYAILCYALHPWLGYMLDSDATAYLTLAKRVADKQYAESVNALWSPMNAWLIAPFIRHGYDAWSVAKALNISFGAMLLPWIHLLFCRFNLSAFSRLALLKASAIFLAFAVYFQVFGDVLQLLFALPYLLLVFSKGYIYSSKKIIAAASLMGIGFYAKAYSLPFFILHSAIVFGYFVYQQQLTRRQAIQHFSLGAMVAILWVLPASISLHQKYHVWSLSGLAGKMNMSWNINSGKQFTADIRLLIPPRYADSPSFWEDPYPSQAALNSPFSSTHHFFHWLFRVAHTCLMSITCFSEISFAALMILLLGIYRLFIRRDRAIPHYNELSLLLLTCLCLPLGYLTMHIETRYLWLEVFLLMILGAYLLPVYLTEKSNLLKQLSIVMLAISFIVYPVIQIEALRGKNKDLFDMASEIKKAGIQGAFTSNASDAGRMWVIAYLNHNPFYTIERTDYSHEELIAEMKRYNVPYYLYVAENNMLPILPAQSFHLRLHGKGFELFELNR